MAKFGYILLLALIVLGVSFCSAFAAGITVSLEVDQKIVPMGDPITVTATVSVQGKVAILPKAKLTRYPNFEMARVMNSSQQINFNGNLTIQNSTDFVLIPKKKGKSTIGPATVKYKGSCRQA